MRQRIAGIFHYRIFLTLVLAFLIVSQGGAAHQIRGGNDPGAIAAAYPHSEPSRGYSSHAPYGEECLHCHAPVGCLASNRCPDCHGEVARECAETEDAASMPPDADTYQISRIERPEERDDAACDAPLGALDHEHLSGFSLDRHKTGFDGKPVTCESCHPEGLYDSSSVACAGCHAKEAPVYMADHTAEHGDGCADCHDGQGGAAKLEAGEAHALDGAHKEAGCQDCHTGVSFADEVRACFECHEEPEVHAGETGQRCEWCHTAVSWTPARLIEHSFRLDHGDMDEASCGACHTGTYETYTCNGCHDHQSAELQERHAQEGIDQLELCGRCHPTGVMGEAARLGHGLGGEIGNLEAPELSPSGQSPAGGAETAPLGQESAEQMGPAEPVGGLTEPVDSMTEPVDSMTGPVDTVPGPTPSMPGEQDAAPARPAGPDDALSPSSSRGG